MADAIVARENSVRPGCRFDGTWRLVPREEEVALKDIHDAVLDFGDDRGGERVEWKIGAHGYGEDSPDAARIARIGLEKKEFSWQGKDGFIIKNPRRIVRTLDHRAWLFRVIALIGLVAAVSMGITIRFGISN